MKINKTQEKKVIKIVQNLLQELYSHKLTYQEAAIAILSFEESMKINEPLLKELIEIHNNGGVTEKVEYIQ